VAKKIEPIIVANPQLRYGTFSFAIEEYVEACAFWKFLEEGGGGGCCLLSCHLRSPSSHTC
jgi:hypothetical protein